MLEALLANDAKRISRSRKFPLAYNEDTNLFLCEDITVDTPRIEMQLHKIMTAFCIMNIMYRSVIRATQHF